MAAIRAEGTELTLRGCSFRRTSSREGRNVAAVSIRQSRPPASLSDRPPAVFVDMCHFDGGQTAILATGPVDLALRNCTMGPGQPSIWFDNPPSSSPVSAELRLSHSSIMAGTEPVFRFDGTQVRVWVDDCVDRAGRPVERDPGHGRQLPRPDLARPVQPLLRHRSLSDDFRPGESARSRSSNSRAGPKRRPIVASPGRGSLTASIWDAADPSAALAAETDNPTRVFLLNQAVVQGSDAGAQHRSLRIDHQEHGGCQALPRLARRAPAGRRRVEPRPLCSIGTAPRLRRRDRGRGSATSSDAAFGVEQPGSRPTRGRPWRVPDHAPDARHAVTAFARRGRGSCDGHRCRAVAGLANFPRRGEPVVGPRGSRPRAARRRSPHYARPTRKSFARAISSSRHSAGSAAREVCSGSPRAPCSMFPATVIDGTGRFQLLAESGGKRPRLRFRPAQSVQRSPVDWTVMVDVRAGSLQLEGLDLIVPDLENLRTDRVAAIGVLPGVELTLTDCTVSVAVNRPGAALFVVQPEIAAASTPASGGTSGQSAVIHLRDCFLRSGGEGIFVAAGRRIDIEMSNVLAATEFTLVHAFGGVRPGRADSPAVKLHLNQVTARIKGGLVHLDSTAEQPELPFASILAENTILSTANHDDPLLRLDGRDRLDDLGNRIQWEGRKVAYDRIKTYRRDEVAKFGGTPRIYDRADWTSAFLPKDESPVLGDVSFLRETDPAQAAWRLDRDDLRLSPQSPVGDTGPDVSRIPEPPAAGGS